MQARSSQAQTTRVFTFNIFKLDNLRFITLKVGSSWHGNTPLSNRPIHCWRSHRSKFPSTLGLSRRSKQTNNEQGDNGIILYYREDLVTLSLKHSDGLSRTRSFYRKQAVTTMSVKKDSQCLQLIYQVVSLRPNFILLSMPLL